MTKNQKITLGVGVILLLFGVKKALAKPGRVVTGNVDFEPPTVSGLGAEQFGGRDYPVMQEPKETEMERLIRVSNELGGETITRDGQAGLANPDYFTDPN